MTVAPTSHAIDVTEHKPGSIFDLNIFHQNLYVYNQALVKNGDDNEFPDNWLLLIKYPKYWDVLLKKDINVLSRMLEQLSPRKTLMGNYYLLMMNF